MKVSKNLPVMVLAILLAACLLTYYSTRESARPAAPQKKSASSEQPLVDTSRLQTALKLAPLAATPDEQGQAHEAWRLADHELDLTFAAALRDAEAEAATALPASGPLRRPGRHWPRRRTVARSRGRGSVRLLETARQALSLTSSGHPVG